MCLVRMRRLEKFRLYLGLALLGAVGSAYATGQPYRLSDFQTVAKFDAHVHANTQDSALVDQARADGFELLSINVDYRPFSLCHDVLDAGMDPTRLG